MSERYRLSRGTSGQVGSCQQMWAHRRVMRDSVLADMREVLNPGHRHFRQSIHRVLYWIIWFLASLRSNRGGNLFYWAEAAECIAYWGPDMRVRMSGVEAL